MPRPKSALTEAEARAALVDRPGVNARARDQNSDQAKMPSSTPKMVASTTPDRLLRHVFAADGGDIEAELIARGLAVRFVHGARPHDWCRP